jgi:hypothetical protein
MRPHAIQSQPSQEPESAQSQPAKGIGSVLQAATDGLAGGERRLLVFRQSLAERLSLPAPLGIGGDDPAAVVAFFQQQRESVGDDALLTECCDLAKKSTSGTPSTLSWFVGWLKKLPMPKGAVSA